MAALIEDHLIFFLEDTSRNQVIKTLVDHTALIKELPDPGAFFKAVMDREQLVSTGIGMGVAIPHAKMADFSGFFVALAILKVPVEWNSIDHLPVKLVFLIGGPDNRQTEYLQILSKITLLIKQEEVRKKLLTLNSKELIVKLLNSTEPG
jgi:PTS system nitrogen regulatory IIA component